MSFTLKLSHIGWDLDEGPHRWIYRHGGSGPARLIDTTTADLEAEVGGRFERQRLYDGACFDERLGNTRCYVDTDPGGPYIWRLDNMSGLPADFDIGALEFESCPAHDVVVWLCNVRQVTALGDVDPSTEALRAVINGNDDRFSGLVGPGRGIEIHTWMGPEKKTARKVIMVGFESGETRTMLVERAWLLGPNGDTVDKVAP